MKTLFCFFLVLAFASMASAMDVPESATNCHCFKDRSFDPQKKFSADSYLLTTSFNSFIAANFHISKSQIVMMKMKGGVSPDDLLIGLYVARAGAIELNSLLAIRDNGGSWQQIIASESMQQSDDKAVLESIARCDDPAEAVKIVTNQLLMEFFKISELAIAALRGEGASGRELTLVYLLENYGKRDSSAADILVMHTREKKSWGEIADFFGFTPKETGTLLAENA